MTGTAAPADAVIDVFTGLDGRSLIPFIDLADDEEVRLFVDLVRDGAGFAGNAAAA